MEKDFSPIVFSGPSGAGKTEFANQLTKRNSLFLEAKGFTTRAKRINENSNIGFLTREEFVSLIAKDEFIEYTIYNNNYYGVPKSEFSKLCDHYLIFTVGYSSAKVISGIYDNTIMIYILPPNKEELLRRMGDRGFERYKLGMEETMLYALKYEYLLLSRTEDFDSIYNDFMDIVMHNGEYQQKKLVLAKNRDFVNNFYKEF